MSIAKEKGIGLVCCIGKKDDIIDEHWVRMLRDNFEKEIAEVTTIWPAESDWGAPQSYIDEMDADLLNIVLVLKGILTIAEIVSIKRKSMLMEELNCIKGKRCLNINPAFLSKSGLGLCSHKSSARREQVADNIFIERQIVAVDKQLMPLPHAFTEYSAPKRIEKLTSLYGELLNQTTI